MAEVVAPKYDSIRGVGLSLEPRGTTVDEVVHSEASVDGVDIYTARITDGYVLENPEARDRVLRMEQRWIDQVSPRDRNGMLTANSAFIANEAAAEFYSEGHPSIRAWRNLVPSALALYPLQNPHIDTLPDGTPLNDTEREYFAFTTDAIALRSRAAVFAAIVNNDDSCNPGNNRWLSLAGGAADPAVKAAKAANDMPELTLVDYDGRALGFAHDLAREAGVDDRLTLIKQDLFDFEGTTTALGGEGAYESFAVADILGFFEYLPDRMSDNPYGMPITAEDFLAYAYRFVEPGGRVVFGNMLDTHPSLDFTTKVVSWPYIQPRSVDEVIAITRRAGITDPVKVYLPDDGVYSVVEIQKPPAAQPE